MIIKMPGGTRKTMKQAVAARSKKTVTISKKVKPAKLKDQTRVAMMNVVNRILNRKSETKYLTNVTNSSGAPYNSPVMFNSAVQGTSQFISALPSMVQGTDDYDRVGDSVVPTKLVNDIFIDFVPKSGQVGLDLPVDLTVHIFYGYCKKYKSWTDVNTNSSALADQLLKLGAKDPVSGSEFKPFVGLHRDTTLHLNQDIFHLKTKKIHMYKSPGYSNGVTSPGIISQPSKIHAHVKLDWTKMLPAKLKYEESADTLPSNYAPFWCIAYSYNDQSTPDTGATGILEYVYTSHLSFKDM